MTIHRYHRMRLLLPMLAAIGLDLTGEAEAAARAEARAAERRALAEAFAAGGAHTVAECEALLQQVGDDQGLADAALRIARAQAIDLTRAAEITLQGGQPLVDQIRAGDFEALCRLTAVPSEALFGRQPTGFEQMKQEHRTRREIAISNKGIVGWTDVATGEQELTGTAEAMRACGMTIDPGIPDDRRVTMRAPVPRGPGLQIRDARTAARMSLRDLGDRLGIPHIELGEVERNLRPVPPKLWIAARAILPGLPEKMPPETARPRTKAEQERDRATMDAFLHPAGRCTCGGGGGGDCEWCVMDRRRALREDRWERRTAASNVERKREVQRAKQARKARRGW